MNQKKGNSIMTNKMWDALSQELAQAAEEAGKSVVAVHGGRHSASGVLLTSNSVVTVSHAVRSEEEVPVIFAGSKHVTSRVAGRDPATDLVALRLHHEIEFSQPRWSTTAKLRIGELTLALARSWRGNIVSSLGVVSGLMPGPWRTAHGGELDQFIRPDLTMYPGFSGGPLLNSQGEFVGINTVGLHRAGITIPASTVTRVARELLEKGRVERPYLGLAMQSVKLQESLQSKLNLTSGGALLVVHVEPGSPAEKAGVLLGDALTGLGGKPVADTDAVQEVLRSSQIGHELEASFIRGGSARATKLKLEARPAR
jgi:S1-C subfamily serine protease